MNHGRMIAKLGSVGAALSLGFGVMGVAATLSALGASPASASTTASPTIYVGDRGHSVVLAFPLPTTGNVAPAATLTTSSIGSPYGQALDAAGDLWSANFSGDSLVKFTPAQLAATGTPTPSVTISANGTSLGGPVGMAFDRSGNLWVADYNGNRLELFTPAQLAVTGNPIPTVVISSGSLNQPEEIAFDGGGDLWVANQGTNQLLEFTPAQLAASGVPAPAILSGPSLVDPESIAIDDAGNLWVGNEGNSTVLEFPTSMLTPGSHTPAVVLSDDGSTAGSIGDPYGMEFDSAGNLWITDEYGSNTSPGISGFAPSQLTVSGSPVPKYKITGTATTFVNPLGMALADPPQAPTHATASLAGSNVTVTWNAPIGRVPATDYQVTPIFNGVAQTPVDTTSTSTSFTEPVGPGGPISFSVTASNVFGTGPASAASNAVTAPQGYWLVASDGGIFTHGSAAFLGSQGATPLNKPIVGMASTPDGKGYWLVASDGGIFTHGDAGFFGSQGATPLNKPIVGMASTPDGKGYWLVASDGGIFTHGDAGFFGSQGATPLNKPIVGMASTPDGLGYWLVASDGGIFTHGDATFLGSQGATPLNKPIVGMASTPDGLGYWLVASDGGIFTHGDATFLGSQGATPLNKPIVGMAASPDGLGYWLVASDGGIFTHGDATFLGSQGATPLNKPIVGMAGADSTCNGPAEKAALVTIDDVRAMAAELPRSYEAAVRGHVRFRVGRIVYVGFGADETVMGFAFPKAERDALVASEPGKFLLPNQGDLRYNWVAVRLDALDLPEMHELVMEAWTMAVPKGVAAAYFATTGASAGEVEAEGHGA